jgi:quercetin dioxygenase-like cupin family protein
MSGPRLERWDPQDGTVSEKRMMNILETEGYEVSTYTYRPGTVFSPHEHAQDKCDAVIEGTFRLTANGVAFDLGPGDRLYIPAGTRHAAEVVGSAAVLSLDGTRW